MYRQFSLETIPHLDKCMVRLISEKFNSDYVPINGEQVEQFIFVYSLNKNKFQAKYILKSVENFMEKGKRGQGNVFTSGLRFATRTVHLSFVPVMPGGKPPPKAAAIAAALAI